MTTVDDQPSGDPLLDAATLTAEVISIGDEMTTGARVDTNSAWLSIELARLGIRTLFHTTVADDLSAGTQAFQIASQRVDVVVATGGLGPTRDDLTREVLAAVAGQPLEFRQEAMDHIEALFARRGRPMPDRNRTQAMFPVGSRSIPNPQGTAAGLDVSITRPGRPATRIFALPGVPAEMTQMFHQTVGPRLIEELGAGRRVMRQHVVKCFGVGESEMESRLGEMIARQRVPSVGITVSRATISLRITTDASSDDEATQQIEVTRQAIFAAVPEFIFGEGEAYELQHAVADALRARGEKLATVEVGAACPITQWMTAANEDEVYLGGIHAADPDTALTPSALLSAADWVLHVDRYPRLPTTDTPLPAYQVTLTVAHRPSGRSSKQEVELGGHPDIIHSRIGKAALDFLRQEIG